MSEICENLTLEMLKKVQQRLKRIEQRCDRFETELAAMRGCAVNSTPFARASSPCWSISTTSMR